MTTDPPDRDRRADAVLAAAVVSGPAASLLVGGFSLVAPVVVAIAVFLLVRFTRTRWQPIAIAVALPEVATALVWLRYPDDSELSSFGERAVNWHLKVLLLAAVTAALVTAAAWTASRLRPAVGQRPVDPVPG
jgi:hypothetical protein